MIESAPRAPSDTLIVVLRQLDSFELSRSEAAKVMLIDALLGEIVPEYPRLKIWKEELLESETVSGIADYLIAPKRAYLETPLLCAIELRRRGMISTRDRSSASREWRCVARTTGVTGTNPTCTASSLTARFECSTS